MIQKTLSSFFSMNRVEENPDDLWGEYVLPHNYKEYNLLHFEKSAHITGGRGIGKTAYLLYHCYPTILSNKKIEISHSDLQRVGIYWKPDSELLEDMTENALEDNWKNAFNAYLGISILIELSKFLKTFLNSTYEDEVTKEEVKNLLLPARLLNFLHIKEDMKFIDFEEEGHFLRSELNDWLCDTSEELPFKFKAKDKIELFIKTIQKIKLFQNIKFYIFIDEFENLSAGQQQIINTWIKHVPENTIYHVAYKKYYSPDVETVGTEKIQEINDYRTINIEDDLIGEESFSLIASEIVLNKLQIFFNTRYKELNELEINYLSKETYIEYRKSATYILSVKTIMNNIFPSYTLKEVSQLMLEDSLLYKKILDSIEKALKAKKSDLSPHLFLDKDKPEESILNASLLHRARINPKILLEKFNDKIEEYSAWKNNNLFGSILYIYNKEKSNRRCPYYAGFEHFIQQSASNIRHFLELVHQSFIFAEKNNLFFRNLETISLPIEYQANVVREVSSKEFDRKVAYLGRYGKKLKKITERLGKLFELAHNNPAQSFAEVNQFALTTINSHELNQDEINKYEILLNELLMWSVLTEKNNTKRWDKSKNTSLKEYRLHPIFSSYFGISFRKKRKFDFTSKEIKTIFLGTDQEYLDLHKEYSKKNNLEDEDYEEKTLLDWMQ